MVDYHAVIGGPITQYSMHVRTGPRQLSDGGAWVVWLDGKAGCVAVEACTEATGSLGPSNDDSPAVQIEMRAAELERASAEGWPGRCPGIATTAEDWGWYDHLNRVVTEPSAGEPADSQWRAGYLAREIATHDDRETRDATAWAWDTSRPLAEQLAGASARDELAKRLLREIHDEDAATEQLAETAADDAGEAQDAANTAALVADLDARGPAYDAINDAFDAEDDAEDAPVGEIHKPDGAL
jgi:hypothetical protein